MEEELNKTDTSSIEVAVDAKGIYRWTIKIYFEGALPTARLAVVEEIKEVDDRLRVVFPRAGQEGK